MAHVCHEFIFDMVGADKFRCAFLDALFESGIQLADFIFRMFALTDVARNANN